MRHSGGAIASGYTGAEERAVELSDGIRLLSGALFRYDAPAECAVTIEDIAAGLSKVCRFAGHIRQFYSVAQHAVNASRIVPPEHAFTALMHDTAEAFTNDLPTPLKHAVPLFKDLEQRIEAAMADRFGFAWPMPEQVRIADLQMLAIEKLRLKGDDSRWTILDGIETDEIEPLVDLTELSPRMAEHLFLRRYAELTGRPVFLPGRSGAVPPAMDRWHGSALLERRAEALIAATAPDRLQAHSKMLPTEHEMDRAQFAARQLRLAADDQRAGLEDEPVLAAQIEGED